MKKKNRWVHVSLDENQHRDLRVHAARVGLAMSDVLRNLIIAEGIIQANDKNLQHQEGRAS